MHQGQEQGGVVRSLPGPETPCLQTVPRQESLGNPMGPSQEAAEPIGVQCQAWHPPEAALGKAY